MRASRRGEPRIARVVVALLAVLAAAPMARASTWSDPSFAEMLDDVDAIALVEALCGGEASAEVIVRARIAGAIDDVVAISGYNHLGWDEAAIADHVLATGERAIVFIDRALEPDLGLRLFYTPTPSCGRLWVAGDRVQEQRVAGPASLSMDAAVFTDLLGAVVRARRGAAPLVDEARARLRAIARDDERAGNRAWALRLLAAAREDDVAPARESLAHDPSVRVRVEAAAWLGEAAARPGGEALLEALVSAHDADGYPVDVAIAAAIGGVPTEAATDALIALVPRAGTEDDPGSIMDAPQSWWPSELRVVAWQLRKRGATRALPALGTRLRAVVARGGPLDAGARDEADVLVDALADLGADDAASLALLAALAGDGGDAGELASDALDDAYPVRRAKDATWAETLAAHGATRAEALTRRRDAARAELAAMDVAAMLVAIAGDGEVDADRIERAAELLAEVGSDDAGAFALVAYPSALSVPRDPDAAAVAYFLTSHEGDTEPSDDPHGDGERGPEDRSFARAARSSPALIVPWLARRVRAGLIDDDVVAPLCSLREPAFVPICEAAAEQERHRDGASSLARIRAYARATLGRTPAPTAPAPGLAPIEGVLERATAPATPVRARHAAIFELGERAGAEAVAALAAAFAGEDPAAVVLAAHALGKLAARGVAGAAAPLVAALGDGAHRWRRRRALEAASASGAASLAAAVVSVVASSDDVDEAVSDVAGWAFPVAARALRDRLVAELRRLDAAGVPLSGLRERLDAATPLPDEIVAFRLAWPRRYHDDLADEAPLLPSASPRVVFVARWTGEASIEDLLASDDPELVEQGALAAADRRAFECIPALRRAAASGPVGARTAAKIALAGLDGAWTRAHSNDLARLVPSYRAADWVIATGDAKLVREAIGWGEGRIGREREPDDFEVRDVLELRLALARLEPGAHAGDLAGIALRLDAPLTRHTGFQMGTFSYADRELRRAALELLVAQSRADVLRGRFFGASLEARVTVVRLLAAAARTSADVRDLLVDALAADPSLGVRVFALCALADAYDGERLGYDPEGAPVERLIAAGRWRVRTAR